MKKPRGVFKKAAETLWMHLEGRTFSISLKAEASTSTRSSNNKNTNGGQMVSPMPGKILRIAVKPNDPVKSGVTVCIIEAMKMEYALKAPFDGVVQKILKKDGEQVNLDELLMILTPQEKK